jgi:hypothetical protein
MATELPECRNGIWPMATELPEHGTTPWPMANRLSECRNGFWPIATELPEPSADDFPPFVASRDVGGRRSRRSSLAGGPPADVQGVQVVLGVHGRISGGSQRSEIVRSDFPPIRGFLAETEALMRLDWPFSPSA